MKIKKKSNQKFLLKPSGVQTLIPLKKLSSRHAENGQPDQSDAENFSQMIQFNDRKDNHEIELSELETFINFQYKKKTTVDNNNGNETSSDDDLSHMFRK
jgi:hypothetical protein